MRWHHAACLLIVIALFSFGCSTPTTPTVVPTATTPAIVGAPSGVAIAGKVYDTAYRPLGGAIVEVIDGPSVGMTVATIASGEFALRGAFDETTHFRATKAGHSEAVLKMGPRCAACNPNFWVYFYLAGPVAPVNIAGDYT